MKDRFRHASHGLTLTAGLAGLALHAVTAGAQCPVNQAQIGFVQGCPIQTSTDPAHTFGTIDPCFNGSGSASYDLAAGTVSAFSHATSDVGFTAQLQTADDFVIVGPASTTPIDFTAVFNVTMTYPPLCPATLTVGALQVDRVSSGPTHQSVHLNLSILPNQHFNVGMHSAATAPRLFSSQVSATLAFTPMPPGYSLQSCQGFSAAAVPTRPVTWGRVKQFYR